MLQIERLGGPLASISHAEDLWSNIVVEEVNQHFDSYAEAFPEWAALRQVFRAYVFAIWLAKHDPDMARRLLAQLPPPRPPSNPLPDVWPDPRLLVMRLGPEPGSVEIEQATVAGGVGFEQNLLKAVAGSTGGGSPGIVSTFPSGAGFTPSPIDDDVPATTEGYRAWRDNLLKERGYLWGWIASRLVPEEVATLAGIALALTLASFWRERKQKIRFSRAEGGAMTVDWLATTLIFALLAMHPDVYKNHTAPFTGWWVAAIISAVTFFKVGRMGRFGAALLTMIVVLIWTAFTPGLGEIVRGLTPLHLAVPPLGGSDGALSTETVYSLEALREGLTLCRSAEPRYALYSVLLLLVVIGLWFEVQVDSLRPKGVASSA